jgi:lipopolysaccharide export system protein LptA
VPIGSLDQPAGPITIDSDRLEVRDREKRAVFTGNVVAKRGDATMRAASMTVFYDAETTQRAAAAANQQPDQQIRRIEMAGPVFFCQRDQAARGDNAVYERAAETLVLTGDVVLTQGQNVITGPRLVVNLRTNQAHVERDPANPNARVRSLLVPGGDPPGAPPAAARPGQPAPPAQAGAPQRPSC